MNSLIRPLDKSSVDEGNWGREARRSPTSPAPYSCRARAPFSSSSAINKSKETTGQSFAGPSTHHHHHHQAGHPIRVASAASCSALDAAGPLTLTVLPPTISVRAAVGFFHILPSGEQEDRSMGGGCLRRRLCLGGTRTLPFVRRFTPREIEAATKGFTAVLEAGGPRGAATAYRARFAGGLVATVVRRAGAASRDDDDGGHHQQQGSSSKAAFYLELQLLARLNHRHVVRLRGFADGHHARFLVFDHMENRSLKECLHDPLRTPLDWRTRLQVAIDIAAALEYLYYFCDPPVFHVAVNSGNVLMDSNFVAKLSDVSVISHDMKLATTESFQDQVEQRRAGLVFQYGVLVLELVTGQSPGGDGELVRWVQEPGFAGSMHRMVDADLGGVYDAGELRDLVIVARLCTRHGHGGGGDGGGAVVSIPQIVRYLQGKVERLGGGEARCG